MSTAPWFPFYAADYLGDTMDLTPEQHGIYVLLLALSWRRPTCSLPPDMKWIKRALASASDMHGNKFNVLVPPILDRFFARDENGDFFQKRLRKEREKSEKLSRNQRENVGKRWSRTKENNDLADTTVIPARASLQSQSQESSSFHSEDSRSPSLRSGDPATVEKVSKISSKGSRLPEGWQPSEALFAFGQAQGFTASEIRVVTATFGDYWRGVPGDRGRKVDWDATFRNWICKDVERRKGPHNGRSRQGNLVEADSNALSRSGPGVATCSPEMAVMSATLLFGCYRAAEASAPKVYLAAAEAVLRCYPERVAQVVCDPVHGLPSRSRFLPSIAEIKEACERANGTSHPPAGTVNPRGFVHDGRGGYDFLANPHGRRIFYDD